MAAVQHFEKFCADLTEKDRRILEDVIRTRRADLLAARSEESRVRIVNEFVNDALEFLKTSAR
jgi:hypothetical protein